jgi:hypothetical protein
MGVLQQTSLKIVLSKKRHPLSKQPRRNEVAIATAVTKETTVAEAEEDANLGTDVRLKVRFVIR